MNQSQLWKHLAALLYDIFPILGILLVTSLLFMLIRGGEEVSPRTLWWQLLLAAEVAMYFIYSWKKGGQTLGMRAWKIGIENYPTLSWTACTWRFVVGLLSVLTLGLGLWWRLFDSQQKTWMDHACSQRVINLKATNA